jgi:hypothetical protein
MNSKYGMVSAAVIAVVAVFLLTSTMAVAGGQCKPEDCKKACTMGGKQSTTTAAQTDAKQPAVTKANATASCCPEAGKRCEGQDKSKCCPDQDKSTCCPEGSGKCCPSGGTQGTTTKTATTTTAQKAGVKKGNG